MSDPKIDEVSNADEAVDLSEIEGQEKPGGETDHVDEADGGLQQIAEGETQPEAESTEEIDLGAIDFGGVSGSRPEQDNDDAEARKRNRHNAEMRVRLKQKEKELEELSLAKDAGHTPEDPKPKRTDFIAGDALYEKYDGNADLARAAYEDALEDWQGRARDRHIKSIDSLNAEVEREKRALAVQDDFEKHSAPWKGKVKSFDANIEKAEKVMTIPDGKGGDIDGSLIVKEHYGEDAPLILAAIGANPKLAQQVMTAPTPAAVHVILAEIRANAKRALTSSSNKISRAQGEQSVKGDANAPMTSLEKALQKAADNRDLKEYQRLQKLIAQKRAS